MIMAYGKIEDGKLIYVSTKKVEKDGMIIYNPSDDMLASAGIYPIEIVKEDGTDAVVGGVIKHNIGQPYEPTYEEELAQAKADKIRQIEEYDKSSAVNEFFINGNPMWVDVDLRNKLKNVIDVENARGSETFTEWYNGISFTFATSMWKHLLNEVEHYAYQCLNVTEQHKYNVNSLVTIAAVEDYDYTINYPTKLNFEV